MSGFLFSVAGAMFGLPMLIMTAIALVGADLPSALLTLGGWTMVFGVILGGIAAVFALAGE